MADIPPIAIQIYVEMGQFNAGMTEAKAKVESLGATATATKGEMEGFGGAIKGLGEAVKGFMAFEVVKFLIDSGKAAIENNKSMAEMARTMHTATGANKEQVGVAEEGIKKLSEMSAVLQKDLRPSFDIFYRSTHDTTKALQLQKIALDVAAGTGRDVESVTKAMSRAYEGNTGALTKLVPSVKNAKDPIKALEESFKGAAKAAADHDPYKRMQQTFDEIKESLGNALMPVFQSLAKILKDLAPLLEMVGQTIGRLVSFVMPVVDALMNALNPLLDALFKILMPIIQIALIPLMVQLKFMSAEIKVVADVLNATLVPAMNWLSGVLNNVLAWALDKVQQGFKALSNFLAPFWNNVLKPIIDGIAGLMGVDLNKLSNVGKAADPTAGFGTSASFVDPNAAGSGSGSGSAAAKAADTKRANFTQWLKDEQAKVKSYEAAFQAKVDDARSTYWDGEKAAVSERDTALEALSQAHADKMVQIESDYSQKLKDIIQQSMDQLRGAFASATAIDVGSMFASSIASSDLASVVSTQMKGGIQTAVSFWGSPSAAGGVAGLLQSMTDKLNSAKALSDNAAKLSGAGFSQTFIEQVVAQGGDVGNKMADQILASTPEMQKSLQDVFAASQSVSDHAMDTLSQSIYDKSGLATEGLQTLYSKTQTDLVNALADENNSFTDQQTKIKEKYDKTMTDLSDALNKALDAASTALDKQLTSAEAALAKKVASMKGSLSGLSGAIGSLQSTISSAKIVDDSLMIAPMAASQYGAFMNTAGYNSASGPAVKETPAPVVQNTYNLNTSISSQSDPLAYQQGLIQQLNYGLPVAIVKSTVKAV